MTVAGFSRLGLNDREARHALPELFADELDSGFSSSVACCDSCYDEFLSVWPLANERNEAEFQRGCMPVDWIFEYSRLRDLITPEEFAFYRNELLCDRCGEPLQSNVWVYELPFGDKKEIEGDILAVSRIGRATPFLLLEHPFARMVLDWVKKLGQGCMPLSIDEPLFRARIDDGHLVGVPEEFEAPPRARVSEGRYNHAGMPVLYAADSAQTCFEELGRQNCRVVAIKLHKEVKVFDLHNPEDAHADDHELLSALAFSALISAPQPNDGWDKPAYVFSRFVADCARAADFDAIRYPSVRSADSFNLVFIRDSFLIRDSATVLSIESMRA